MESEHIISQAKSLQVKPSEGAGEVQIWQGQEGGATFTFKKVEVPIRGMGAVYSLLLQGNEADMASLARDFTQTLGEPEIFDTISGKESDMTYCSWDVRRADERMNSEPEKDLL